MPDNIGLLRMIDKRQETKDGTITDQLNLLGDWMFNPATFKDEVLLDHSLHHVH